MNSCYLYISKWELLGGPVPTPDKVIFDAKTGLIKIMGTKTNGAEHMCHWSTLINLHLDIFNTNFSILFEILKVRQEHNCLKYSWNQLPYNKWLKSNKPLRPCELLTVSTVTWSTQPTKTFALRCAGVNLASCNRVNRHCELRREECESLWAAKD